MSATNQRYTMRKLPFWDSESGETRMQPVVVAVPEGNPAGYPLADAYRIAKRAAGWKGEVPR
jgi:hypothetical protein